MSVKEEEKKKADPRAGSPESAAKKVDPSAGALKEEKKSLSELAPTSIPFVPSTSKSRNIGSSSK